MNGYLTRLICAAMVCALIRALSGENRGLLKMLCGIFLMLTVLSPVAGPVVPELDPDRFARDAEAAAREGADLARAEQEGIITEACEAYIWNKAAAMGLELTVRVELNEDLIPRAAVLKGEASPLERQSLTECITRDLGLGKEAVTWIDPYQSSE